MRPLLLILLLAACGEPQPEPIDPSEAITEDAIDPLPEGPLDPLAVGQRYDDVDDLALAAAPMAPDLLVETEERADGRLLVKIEASGFEDDAVEAQRFDVTAARGPDGLVVEAVLKMYRCRRDGTDEWTEDVCP